MASPWRRARFWVSGDRSCHSIWEVNKSVTGHEWGEGTYTGQGAGVGVGVWGGMGHLAGDLVGARLWSTSNAMLAVLAFCRA